MKTVTYDETKFVLVPVTMTVDMRLVIRDFSEAVEAGKCRLFDVVWRDLISSAPPQPEQPAAVPLTEEQITDIASTCFAGHRKPEIKTFARAIERAHGITVPEVKK